MQDERTRLQAADASVEADQLLDGPGSPGGSVSPAAQQLGRSTTRALGLTDADKARLTVELTEGKAAVGVLAHFDTAPAISDRLTQLGGTPEAHQLTDEALQAAEADASRA